MSVQALTVVHAGIYTCQTVVTLHSIITVQQRVRSGQKPAPSCCSLSSRQPSVHALAPWLSWCLQGNFLDTLASDWRYERALQGIRLLAQHHVGQLVQAIITWRQAVNDDIKKNFSTNNVVNVQGVCKRVSSRSLQQGTCTCCGISKQQALRHL